MTDEERKPEEAEVKPEGGWNLPQLPSKRIEWYIPDTLPSVFANQLFVQVTNHEFIFLFFDSRTPLLSGTYEEQLAQLERLESLKAVCVARVVIARERAPEFVSAILDVFQKFYTLPSKEE